MATKWTEAPDVNSEPILISATASPWRKLVVEVTAALPELIACGIVDLDSGEWCELQTLGAHPVDFLAYLARSTQGYFEGDSVRTVRAVLDEPPAGAESAPRRTMGVEEITMTTGRTLHVMVRLAATPRLVLAVVAARQAKLGWILSTVRSFATGGKGG